MGRNRRREDYAAEPLPEAPVEERGVRDREAAAAAVSFQRRRCGRRGSEKTGGRFSIHVEAARLRPGRLC